VVGRKASKTARAAAPDNTPKTYFPPLPLPKLMARRLPPLRNAALIIKVPTGFSFEDTVKTIQESVVNPGDFGATSPASG